MMLAEFGEVWAVDFEFTAHTGERPIPVCMVARELHSGRTIRLFEDQFGPAPPFSIGPTALFIAYYASAELGCFRVLGWPMPARVLDLCAEFRDRTCGLDVPAGRSLIGALVFHGLDHIDAAEKKEIQEAIGNGTWRGRYTPKEILDYCETDVEALQRLLPAMLPHIDLPRALLRGRYMAAAAVMEWNGVPRSLRNFPMQANGAEMLRLACCLGVESGIEICAPVHDAVLICAPVDRLEADIERMRNCMARASREVLGGFELRTDVARVVHPDRYQDPRGAVMWDRVMALLKARQQTKRAAAA
jgi:hypothetical protein